MAIWNEDFVIVNKFSRPTTKLVGVRGIVMHWTADSGATDENEQNFFDGSDGGGGRYASAHFFIDRDSSTLIIPLNEVAYHANEHPCKVAKLQAKSGDYVGGANLTAIGIEMCVEKDGTIHPDTVARAIDVAVELCKRYKLDPINDIYRHFDITGKNCPAPWVSDSSKFVNFKNSVKTKLAPAPAPAPKPAPAPAPVKPAPATKPVPAPKPVPKKKYVVLPASADTWNIYPLNKAPIKANACGQLSPKKFKGLTYEVIGNPQTDVYTIQTDSFGKVNIYANEKITGAKIIIK